MAIFSASLSSDIFAFDSSTVVLIASLAVSNSAEKKRWFDDRLPSYKCKNLFLMKSHEYQTKEITDCSS